MLINFNAVQRVISVLLVIIGVMMWTGLPFSLYFGSGDGFALGVSCFVSVVACGGMFLVRDI